MKIRLTAHVLCHLSSTIISITHSSILIYYFVTYHYYTSSYHVGCCQNLTYGNLTYGNLTSYLDYLSLCSCTLRKEAFITIK